MTSAEKKGKIVTKLAEAEAQETQPSGQQEHPTKNPDVKTDTTPQQITVDFHIKKQLGRDRPNGTKLIFSVVQNTEGNPPHESWVLKQGEVQMQIDADTAHTLALLANKG